MLELGVPLAKLKLQPEFGTLVRCVALNGSRLQEEFAHSREHADDDQDRLQLVRNCQEFSSTDVLLFTGQNLVLLAEFYRG